MKYDDILRNANCLKGWEICEEIGRGGYGTVYRVRNRRLGDYSALKWIRIQRDKEASQEEFRKSRDTIYKEISVLQNLSDIPEVVGIKAFDVETAKDDSECNAFIRMEFLTPLLEHIRNGVFTLRDTLNMLFDIASALEACHNRNVVHGDIKCENILVGDGVFKLADFGIATALNDLNIFPLGAGTRAYQPPEYFLGDKPTPQGDIYSLGLMFYLLMNNGLLPFQEENTEVDLERALEERYNRVEEGDSQQYAPPCAASPVVSQFILRCCAPEKQDRFKNMGDLKAALEEIQKQISPEEAATPISLSGTSIKNTGNTLQPNNVPTKPLLFKGNTSSTSGPVQQEGPQNPNGSPRPKRSKPSDGEPEEDPPPPIYRRKLFLPIFLACCAVILITGVIVYFVLRPTQPLKANVIPSSFSAEIQYVGGQGDLILYPSAQPNAAKKISRLNLPVTIQHLIPTTVYTLSSNGRQMQFVTTSTDTSLWARGEAKIYTVSKAVIDDIIAYANVSLSDYVTQNGTSTTESLILENQAKQGMCSYLVCAAKYLKDIPEDEVQTVVVLRTEKGEVYSMESRCSFTDINCLILMEISELFEQRFEAYDAQFYGNVAIELYVNGGQAGYVEIKTEKKLSEGY